jgi:hypothetical protein
MTLQLEPSIMNPTPYQYSYNLYPKLNPTFENPETFTFISHIPSIWRETCTDTVHPSLEAVTANPTR